MASQDLAGTDPSDVVLVDMGNKRSDILFCLPFEKTKKNERLDMIKKQT
jgi:hypothetical protein